MISEVESLRCGGDGGALFVKRAATKDTKQVCPFRPSTRRRLLLNDDQAVF